VTDEALIASFEAGEAPPDGFHHREHVRVAWWYLRRHVREDALTRFREALQRFAAAQGKPALYHETITTAFVLLIHERLEREGGALPWREFAARNADLLTWKPSILDRHYRPETLASARAKRAFVPPDLLPLPLTTS
jgi:hypothetical protein